MLGYSMWASNMTHLFVVNILFVRFTKSSSSIKRSIQTEQTMNSFSVKCKSEYEFCSTVRPRASMEFNGCFCRHTTMLWIRNGPSICSWHKRSKLSIFGFMLDNIRLNIASGVNIVAILFLIMLYHYSPFGNTSDKLTT